jgi:putative salt-induced outer membrane protein YdiY
MSTNGNFENGFGFSTSLNMSSRRGYSSADMNTNELIWNAQVSYRFLEGRRATISLQANDILHNRSNISRTINATMRSDSRTNSINSYVMVNFNYRFGQFGGGRNRGNVRTGGEQNLRGENKQNSEIARPQGERPSRNNGGMPIGGPGSGRR